MSDDHRQVEATGETVGEAKWAALRELEKLHPDLDKSAVEFQVVSEGERGLLGVGYAPARVIASIWRCSSVILSRPHLARARDPLTRGVSLIAGPSSCASRASEEPEA